MIRFMSLCQSRGPKCCASSFEPQSHAMRAQASGSNWHDAASLMRLSACETVRASSNMDAEPCEELPAQRHRIAPRLDHRAKVRDFRVTPLGIARDFAHLDIEP